LGLQKLGKANQRSRGQEVFSKEEPDPSVTQLGLTPISLKTGVWRGKKKIEPAELIERRGGEKKNSQPAQGGTGSFRAQHREPQRAMDARWKTGRKIKRRLPTGVGGLGAGVRATEGSGLRAKKRTGGRTPQQPDISKDPEGGAVNKNPGYRRGSLKEKTKRQTRRNVNKEKLSSVTPLGTWGDGRRYKLLEGPLRTKREVNICA